ADRGVRENFRRLDPARPRRVQPRRRPPDAVQRRPHASRRPSHARPRRGSARPRLNPLSSILPAALVAWGALAFGAVYAWAYVPLLAGASVFGLAEIARGRKLLGLAPVPAVGAALGLVVLAIGLQLVPVPRSVLAAVSPSTDEILRRY